MAASTRKSEKPAPEFERVRSFLKRFILLPTEDDYDVATLWAMGTWTFSPASPCMPHAYPYLYIAGAKNSGKTHFGVEVMQYVCRQHKAIAQTTGATLFRMIGNYDPESGEVIPHYPTLAIDEVDAIYASGGSNDEQMRGVGNAGYKYGSTVTRSAGKTSIEFPVYCPKMWIGIDNGRLPDTLTSRCIRIDLRQGTAEQLDQLEEGPYSFEVADEVAEMQQALSDWAKCNAMVLREYKPARPEGIHARKWEISRALIQLARAAGVEQRITDALVRVLGRSNARPTGKEAMYKSLARYLDMHPDEKQFLTRDLVAHLDADGVQLPGRGGGKGLSAAMSAEGVGEAIYIRLRGQGKPQSKWDPRVTVDEITGKPRFVARGYKRFQLEQAIGAFSDENAD